MIALEISLWLLIATALYSVFGYPCLVILLGRAWKTGLVREPIFPTVSIIVSAYNEEKAIAEKLDNTLALEYPRDRLEIIVASDGSSDGTDAIVNRFHDRGVRLLRFDGGLGKTAVLNRAATAASGEILVFSDATGMWDQKALSAMMAHFADPKVGCVSGRVGYSYDTSPTSSGFGWYQRYVLALRRSEAAFGSGFNASGSIHSIRKTAFLHGPADTFMDMVDPLHVAMQGLRTTFEENAVSMERSRTRTSEEFRARLRIALRSWRFLAYAMPRLPVFRSPMYCFQVVSHKFLRWGIGPSLPLMLFLNLLLVGRGTIYAWLLGAQLSACGLTLLGLGLGRLGVRAPLLPALVFFNTTNLAYLISLLRYARGERAARWIPDR